MSRPTDRGGACATLNGHPLAPSPRPPHARRPGPRRRAAFTVIEMIVAMVLLAVGIGGAVLAVGSSTRVSGASKDQTLMALLAQRRLTEIETEGAADGNGLVEGSDAGDFGDDYPDYSWEQDVTATDTADLLQVDVRVIHRTRTQERTFELVTLRLAPPADDTSNTANTAGNTTGTGGTSGG